MIYIILLLIRDKTDEKRSVFEAEKTQLIKLHFANAVDKYLNI